MSEEKLTDVMTILPKYSRQLMLNYLMENADIYSPRRLSISLKKMHDKFQRKGMIDEDTYYYVPDKTSSYSIIAMMYKLSNNIPNNKFIFSIYEIPENAKRLVVLDDISGSGFSLSIACKNLYNSFNQNITIAPVLSTYSASKHLFESINKFTFCPHKMKDDLNKSTYYNSLNKREKILLEKYLAGMGWGQNGLSVVFPYMAPDNNARFFAEHIAPNYTLNSRGVK